MVLNGSLAITVHRIEVDLPTPTDGSPLKHEDHNVKFTLGGEEKHTKFNKSKDDTDIEQTLTFDLKDIADDDAVLMEINTHKQKKNQPPLVANKVPLNNFIANMKNIVVTFKVNGPKSKVVKVYLSSQWAPKGTAQKLAGESAGKAADASAAAALGRPQTALALTPTHRPWFLRASYYYDTTKHVYAYTTSFRVVAGLARFGESSVDAVLQKVSGKTLRDLDAQLLVPVLGSLDDKVDATISGVVTKLFEGQQLVLKTKDAAVAKASSVAAKGTSSLSSVAGTTYSGVVKVKDYTTSKVVGVTSAALSTASSVKDYTTTQVVSVSSTTYNTAKGATVYVLSHVPYLGAKIRA